jgi:tetratricopeptide (TPR) repeat protein
MKTRSLLVLLALCVGCCFAGFSQTADVSSNETTNEPSATALQSQELLRSNLQLQEQLHNALRAIEQGRRDAEAAAQKNADLFTERLNAVEKNLAAQREHDLQALVSMRESNRFVLIAAASVAAVGILALFLTAFFQVRAMNRIAEVSAMFSSHPPIDPARSLGNGHALEPLNPSEQVTGRFLAAVSELEKRVHELDSNVSAPLKKSAGKSNGADPKTSTKRQSLLAEGQSLLNNGHAEKALRCFDEALELEPNCAEALIKKGTALEALRKMNEAIEAYDRAIAADGSLTVAYLYKGGVLNRLQRFSEAMECYEKALHTHPKKAA